MPAFAGIEVSEAVKSAGGDFKQRNLARGVVIVPAAVQFDGIGAAFAEPLREVGGEIVAAVIERLAKRTIGEAPLIGDEGIEALQRRTERQEAAFFSERAALDLRGPLIRQRLP